MDDTLCRYSEAHAAALLKQPRMPFPQSQYGFFRDLKEVPHAVEAWHRLSAQHSVYILTAPSLMNPMSYMEKRVWVEEHLGYDAVQNLIIAYDKSMIRGDILIDDKEDSNGQDRFQGRVIQFGSSGYPDWFAVVKAVNAYAKERQV
jgi:5'(3')-deoxyribonucleotidase